MMAHKRKRVGEVDTTTILLIGGAVLVIGFVVMQQKAAAATPVMVRTAPTNNAVLTAAEISAGAGVVNTLINDLSSSSDSSDT